MNNNNSSITLQIIKYLFLTFAMLGANPLLANDFYSVDPYIDFSTQGMKETTWLAPIANTTQDDELFFVNTHGEIYRSKGQKVGTEPVINLSEHIKNQTNLTFTALTLHPSFDLPDQEGSYVIYTAHIEKYDPSIKKNRLDNKEIEKSHSHDAVITEFQLSNVNNNKVNIIHQREVLRIASTSADININQLSFNPYLKSWSDDFGLLYIAFENDNTLQKTSLYSGTILRINPNKFGLKNYTIPRNNPFIKNPQVEDEIVVLGAQEIQHFTWSKKTRNQLILTHQFNAEQNISVTPVGSDYLQTEPLNIIYKRKNPDSLLSTVYYRSRELNTLWNKILFIEKVNNQWQLSATNIVNQSESEVVPTAVLNLNPKQVNPESQLALYIPRENELLIWDRSQAIIYKVLPHLSTDKNFSSVKELPEESGSNTLPYTFLILILAAILFIYIKKQYGQNIIRNKSLLRANFARFEFDTETKTISLFKRHETEVNTSLSVVDIASSEVWLNNTLLNTVSIESGRGFDLPKENALRLSFEQEHRDKMVDDKVRQISVKLITSQSEQYHICAYLREGNQRLTKEKYHNVIDHIIDWNWYFSALINKNETPERPVKTPEVKPKLKPEKAKVITPIKTKEVLDKKVEPTSLAEEKVTQSSVVESSTAKTKTKAKVDTKLIEALNKLAVLKQQGYLTEEEFALAKANLLESLSASSAD
ncbi:hypothetical protein ACPUVO_01655 [Pseudocolwellia sp. HL-MZ19]|uniref:SHOCT domain-containing protein n=1 Tax=Pseudocolwellia sp. HL-MZ19 TaxID=3400846 RepID=UPI003CEEC554